MTFRAKALRAGGYAVGVPLLALAGLAVAIVLAIAIVLRGLRMLTLAAIGRAFPL